MAAQEVRDFVTMIPVQDTSYRSLLEPGQMIQKRCFAVGTSGSICIKYTKNLRHNNSYLGQILNPGYQKIQGRCANIIIIITFNDTVMF
jgi:hypothetical protein